MNAEKMIQRFESDLPGHKVKLSRYVNMDLKPMVEVVIDDKVLTATWCTEMAQDLSTLHGVDGEEQMYQNVLSAIKSELKIK